MKSIVDPISDLSLLEISGEDDSLLSDNTPTVTAANVFSCSPLVSARSRPRQIKGSEIDNVDSEDLDSSRNDSGNKENAKWSKPEGVDSSQKKKRKKKLGGFNLRKSLAWDRAFFTEQGVLNPLELSMISGTVTPNSKSNLNLEAIEEEEPATTSLALQEIEENLFKHSSGGVSIRNRKISAVSALSPKPGSSIKKTTPVASLAKRKILAVNDVGNKYKRSACPRPVITSSSTDTVKTPGKESKITRIPVPKSSATATTTRSGMLSSGSTKRNQIANPVTNVLKYAGVKGPSKNPRTVASIPKVDLADKCSVSRTLTKPAGKHLDNSVSAIRPPSRMNQTGNGANKVSEAGFPPSRMHQTGSGANKVSEACLPQGISDTDKKKQQTLFQTSKSSGLRMPSPSIGFFSQAKASSSNGQLQKSSIPCKPSESNIPKLRKLGTSSVNDARSKTVQGAAKIRTKELSLSDVKSEPVVQVDNKQMAEVECDSSSFEKISKQPEVKNILEDVMLKSQEQGELHENEHDSGIENMVLFPTDEKELLTKSHTHEQLEKETDRAMDEKLYDVSSNGDQSLYVEPQSTNCPIMQETSNNVSNTVHNAIGQDEDDQIKGPTCDIPAFKEILVLLANHETSIKDGKHSGEFKECNSVKTALLNCSLDDFWKTVPEGSEQGNPCKNTEEVNCGAGEFGRYGDVQLHLSNENLSIKCNETTQSNLEAVSQQLLGEQLKTPFLSSVGEIGSEKENIPDMNSSQPAQVTTLFSKGSPEKSILEINGASKNESKIAEIKDCQLPVDGQSGFSPRSPMDGQYDHVIDSKAIHDKTQEFELDKLSEGCMTVSATACCTIVTNVSPERRPFPENNVINLRLTPQLCPMVKSGCDSGGNNMPITNSSSISELQIKDGNFSTDSSINCEVQCDVPGNIEQQASSVFIYPEINEISCEDESLVPNHGHLFHQSEFSEVSPDVISNIEDPIGTGAENSSGLLQHTQLSLADNNINAGSHLPEFQKPSAAATVDTQVVNNRLHLDSDFLPTIIVSSAEIKQQTLVDSAFEGCRFDTNECGASNHRTYRDIEESHMEEAQMQSFDEIPVAYDCSSKHCPALINDQFSLADDNNRNEDSHLPRLQKPSDVVALDSQRVNNILHLDIECVPTNIASSAEINEQNLVEGAFEGSNEHNPSNHHIQDMPENKDANHDGDEKVELLQIDGAEERSSGISPEVEIQLNENVISVEFDSSVTEVSEDRFEGCRFHSKEHGTSNHHIQDMPENKDGNHVVDERVELLQIIDAEDSSDIFPVVEIQLNETVTNAEFGSSTTEVSEDPFEGCGFHSNEHYTSYHHIQDMPENKDGNHDVDEKVELLQIDGAEEGSSDISSVVEIQVNETVISAEFDSSTTEVSEDPSEGCGFLGNEHCTSNHHIQDMPENKDGNHDVDERVELLQIDGAVEGSSDISSVVEVQLNETAVSAYLDSSTTEVSEGPFASVAAWKAEEQCFLSENSELLASDNPTFNATIPEGSKVNPVKLNEIISTEFDSSTQVNEDPFTSVVTLKSEEQCLLSEESKLLASDNPTFNETIPQDSEVSSLKLNEDVVSAEFDFSIEVSEDPFTSSVALKSEEQCLLSEESKLLATENPTFDATIPQGSDVSSVNSESLPDVGETNICRNDKFPKTDMLCQTKCNINFPEDNSKMIHLEKVATKSKQEVPIVKPPPNVAPFTEEWLAAIEAAGEEILTMKGGAVQNSPPEKAQHEPSPWSPVKKNQAIGPFDCTKVTKHNIQNSDPS